MKPYERRTTAAYPYFKLAVWDAQLCVWRDGKVAFATKYDAMDTIRLPGRYRISMVTERGRVDHEPFNV